MANLIVTFGKSLGGKLEYGPDARTELVAIGGGHEESTLESLSSEDVMTVYAEADCWYAIGVNPDAEAAQVGANRRFLAEGKDRQFTIGRNMRVSVTAT